MTIENIFNYSISILSLIAIIISWIVKLKWSNQFKEAKQAEIETLERGVQTLTDTKDAQIETLRQQVKNITVTKDALIETLRQQVQTYKEFTPDRIKKFYVNIKDMFENNIVEHEKTIEKMKKRILSLEDEVKSKTSKR